MTTSVPPSKPSSPRTGATPAWRTEIDRIARLLEPPSQARRRWPAKRQLLYVVDLFRSAALRQVVLATMSQDRRQDNTLGKPALAYLTQNELPLLSQIDRELMQLLLGCGDPSAGTFAAWPYHADQSHYRLSAAVARTILPRLAETGRLFVITRPNDPAPELARFESDRCITARLVVEPEVATSAPTAPAPAASPAAYVTRLALYDETGARLAAPPRMLAEGIAYDDGAFFRAEIPAGAWLELLTGRPLRVPRGEEDAMLSRVLSLPGVPPMDLPGDLAFQEAHVIPAPILSISTETGQRAPILVGRVDYDYGGHDVPSTTTERGVLDPEQRRYLVRDHQAEERFRDRMLEAGYRPTARDGVTFQLSSQRLPDLVRTLLDEGWRVEAEGRPYRRGGAFAINVTSGLDWFEVHGSVTYDEEVVPLPKLLAALRRGERMIRLGDGSVGLLPEEWLQRYLAIGDLAQENEEYFRFEKSQVGVLDALLATVPEVPIDERVAQARAVLATFDGVAPADPPPSFIGTLRGYQREGLGWALALQRLGFGGCLADDMGLGKTVIVLALLESRRRLRRGIDGSRPTTATGSNGSAGETVPAATLVVVPRSLLFNWREEAARFTPELRIVEHTGTGRQKDAAAFDDVDVVLTTYGTLRRDAAFFKDIEFDYAILDEAQAIKNAASESAKAARLLRARHRLALSGTPVENHLGELWSLFEFLNPGMLGAASAFDRFLGAESEGSRDALRRALRPFILRRTKSQVATDLPEKTEQTVECELEEAQRRQYDELREYYRARVLGAIEEKGMARSKLDVLEALLRLRQVACHPALIDEKLKRAPSAKFEALLSMVDDVIEVGGKALIFSQFTKLLGLLRTELDARGITYEYLDGRTRDRKSRVDRFQTDPDCPLFLISLKAGGVGLNLTAAEYVFLLDPWWNPAVEQQAVDRAHRIGQKRSVFAYRLVASNTIEDRVVELQSTKRELADAIINEDNSLIKGLGREEFELLLS